MSIIKLSRISFVRQPPWKDVVKIAATAEVSPNSVQSYFKGGVNRGTHGYIDDALDTLGWSHLRVTMLLVPADRVDDFVPDMEESTYREQQAVVIKQTVPYSPETKSYKTRSDDSKKG